MVSPSQLAARTDVVVIGASAGGVEALTSLVAGLPVDIAAAIFVVVHVPSHHASALPTILMKVGGLHAVHPANGDPIEYGRIYVAPPDRHMLLRGGRIVISAGPRENHHRPAIDPLFRSAALEYGPRVAGVVLSGMLDDGTAGLLAVKRRGGIAIVQDPADAGFGDMPRHAAQEVEVDYRLRAEEIGSVIYRLTANHASGDTAMADEQMATETDIAWSEEGPTIAEQPGEPSRFSCPDCGGVLNEVPDGDMLRFRCRVGHAFSPESLLAQQGEAVETALWASLRSLEEHADLAKTMARRARERQSSHSAQRFEDRHRELSESATVIRHVLFQHGNGQGPAPESVEATPRSAG
jgi:two-component system chemotaxis response regulator CheB